MKNPAFIGIAFSNDVIYNYVDDEGQFKYTGMSFIRQLKKNRNDIMARIIKSQSYDCIRYLMDDEVIYGDRIATNNTNVALFNEIYRLMNDFTDDAVFEYYYIYDVMKDVIILKTPDISKAMVLEYNNPEDVEYFFNIGL